MDEFGFIVLIGIAVLAIPIMGLVAFFRTGSLRRQVSELELRVRLLEKQPPSSETLAARSVQGAPDASLEPVSPPAPEPVRPEPEERPGLERPEENEEEEEPPVVQPIAASVSAPASSSPAAPARSLEEAIGTRWVVWVGGVALGLGGLFLVRYSIEQGWFGPGARIAAGALFALALVAAGEWMRRRDLANPRPPAPEPAASAAAAEGTLQPFPVPDIPSVLTAAGTLSAFATVYAAHALYDMIGAAPAFILLGIVGLATMGAAALHGPMLAGLGLVASFAAPALVSSGDPRPWPVVLYLVVVAGSAYGLARVRRWLWLAIVTAVGAALWARLIMDLGDHAVEAAAHIVFQAALAAALVIIGPNRGRGDEVEELDWLGVGFLAVFAVLSCDLLTDWSELGAARVPFAAAMLAVSGYAGLRIAPAAAGVLAGAAVAVAALFGWPMLAEIARETTTGFPAPGGPAPLPDTLWLFLTFGAIAAAVLTGAPFIRLMRSPRLPRLPAALYAAAAVLGPIALLVVAWWRVSNLDRSVPFALVAAVLAFVFVSGATQLRRRFGEIGDIASRYGYEAFAAGAIGALAAGLTMALDKGSLTVALALSAVGAAWVTTREPLGLLRFAVGALGVAVAGRLAWDPTVVSGDLGTTPIFNWLLWGYGVPALSFGAASVMLRRQADDQVVALCEALALAFTGFLVMFEIRHLVSGGRIDDWDVGHLEVGLQAFASLMLAVIVVSLEVTRRSLVIRAATYVFGALGLGLAVFGLLLVSNPLFNGYGERILGGAFFNSLLVAYLLPALAALALAWRARGMRPRWFVMAANGLGFLLGALWVVLEIRRLFQGEQISFWRSTSDAEFYTYSAVFLAIGLVLLAFGILRGSRQARLGSAVFILLAVAKAFIFDMAGLTGAYRALSFIGLGLVLVGIGLVYQKLVFRPAGGTAGPASPPSPSPPGDPDGESSGIQGTTPPGGPGG